MERANLRNFRLPQQKDIIDWVQQVGNRSSKTTHDKLTAGWVSYVQGVWHSPQGNHFHCVLRKSADFDSLVYQLCVINQMHTSPLGRDLMCALWLKNDRILLRQRQNVACPDIKNFDRIDRMWPVVKLNCPFPLEIKTYVHIYTTVPYITYKICCLF